MKNELLDTLQVAMDELRRAFSKEMNADYIHEKDIQNFKDELAHHEANEQKIVRLISELSEKSLSELTK